MSTSPRILTGVGKGFRDQALRRVVPEPWLSSQGGVHSQRKLVLKVARGTHPLKRTGLELEFAYGENILCFFIKKKRYRDEDKLGLKKIRQLFLAMALEMLVGIS
jgi:hypothetical protein